MTFKQQNMIKWIILLLIALLLIWLFVSKDTHAPIAEVSCPHGKINPLPPIRIETKTRAGAQAMCERMGSPENIGGCAKPGKPWTIVYPEGHEGIEAHELRHSDCMSLEHK